MIRIDLNIDGDTPADLPTRLEQMLTDTLRRELPDGAVAGTRVQVSDDGAPDPAKTVRSYLDTMEAGDLDKARSFQTPDFVMTFPSGRRMTDVQELVTWSKSRYQFVRKSYERFDIAAGPEGPIVYCFGTLRGEWPDGTPFDGVRFIDRFGFRGTLLAVQDVWNDLEAVRPRD